MSAVVRTVLVLGDSERQRLDDAGLDDMVELLLSSEDDNVFRFSQPPSNLTH